MCVFPKKVPYTRRISLIAVKGILRPVKWSHCNNKDDHRP